MTRASPEYDLQCAVVQHLKRRQKPGVFFFAVPNGEKRSAITGARLKKMGVRAGVADLVVLVNGTAFGIELKASAKGRQSPAQVVAGREWEDAGGEYFIASSLDDALELLEQIGAIHPNRWEPA